MPLTKGRKLKMRNRLWRARKRVGLGQKQLAGLLNQGTADQISRYEHGARVPTLRIALKLEIVLGTPLKLLFNELYEQLREEVRRKLEQQPLLKDAYRDAGLEHREYCTIADLLGQSHPSETDKRARSHITELAKKIAYL